MLAQLILYINMYIKNKSLYSDLCIIFFYYVYCLFLLCIVYFYYCVYSVLCVLICVFSISIMCIVYFYYCVYCVQVPTVIQ